MNKVLPLAVTAFAILAFATLFLVILPAAQIRGIEPAPGLEPYTEAEARGREHYVDLGCYYCHSQQPRSSDQAPDPQRGWGRPTTPADYVYDEPHTLGTMRTGPDLMNVGKRLPSEGWHLTHLYQPRAVSPSSLMPAYPFLFEVKAEAGPDDRVVAVPEEHAPEEGVVVAKQSALDLTAYLLSLDRSYPPARRDLRDLGYGEEG
ncbi:cbb3-type cytochrome c oxidase subunit II [Rhodosalinus sediminis]|jgi:cytochrome c oxidase cbb3-type subunit 2|uniref:cbb3-type cytochrome c oxidase subunit II n=1 Tax=Rhodosalinus sediminis TaxID=1940533 RepID=UPI002354B5E0|nr:cbb3-type cytochrome c oxidase subunit II [Rhodosalinus sediminis]